MHKEQNRSMELINQLWIINKNNLEFKKKLLLKGMIKLLKMKTPQNNKICKKNKIILINHKKI